MDQWIYPSSSHEIRVGSWLSRQPSPTSKINPNSEIAGLIDAGLMKTSPRSSSCLYWGFLKQGNPKMDGFLYGKPLLKWDDLRVPLFFRNTYIFGTFGSQLPIYQVTIDSTLDSKYFGELEWWGIGLVSLNLWPYETRSLNYLFWVKLLILGIYIYVK